ncbi:piggyBac transposable element-derived protein 4-like [Mya arenaria]|uniref:piggyBac transposable element-derived protein 4-like n=1 Tax=Mya arenaria TaxID=6604 RepID=UPI0022E6B471|nr:piggyBac transposable element-derived protein 4-like [Mya arenaria]
MAGKLASCSGITQSAESATRRSETDFFKLFVDNELIEKLTTETNVYAANKIRILEAGNALKPNSRLRKWSPVSVEEMKVFLAVVINMGLVFKSEIESYWSTDPSTEIPFFGKTMTRDRFLIILSNFHVTNELDNRDPLTRLRPLITHAMARFSEVYTPEQNLSFDEGTCPWKGRLKIKVYNPAKPQKFGIKLFQLCEASSGYCLGFDVYAGKRNEDTTNYCEAVGVDPENLTLTSQVVVGLMARCGVLSKGHHVYMDNYYTSPELFSELDVLNTYACGTLRVNRIGTPKAIQLKRKLNEGECIYRTGNNMLAMKFKDKRDVHMLSTIHNPMMSVLWKKKHGTDINVRKPSAIVDYCKHMGGVDLLDQFGQYNTVARKTKKWWRKLFFHIMNICIVNAYRLYEKYSTNFPKKDHEGFRKSVVEALIEEGGGPRGQSVRRGRPSLGEKPARLTGRHFPDSIPAKPGAKRAKPCRDCVACNDKPGNREGHKRKQTAFWCPDCQVALCNPYCFRIYHTHQDYKTILNNV